MGGGILGFLLVCVFTAWLFAPGPSAPSTEALIAEVVQRVEAEMAEEEAEKG